jgi:CRP-like cAMP-binding protein
MASVVDLSEIRIVNPVWLACKEETRAALQARGNLRAFDTGASLFQEGEPSGVAFFPLSGKVLVSKNGRGGRRQVLCKLDPSYCGGPCMLMMGDSSVADARALEPGYMLDIKREDLEDVVMNDPELGRVVLRNVVGCMSHFINALGNLSFNKVAQRVALALLDSTANNGGLVRQTQAELAAEVGTTREVVARCLADLQETGAIKLGRGRISVLDREQLQHVS